MRTAAVAATYFTNLKEQFARQTYANAALRGRGLNGNCNVNELFYIYQRTLAENEIYNTLTEQQRDQIIDYLIETTL